MRRGYFQGYVNNARNIMPGKARELGKMFQDIKYEHSTCLFDNLEIKHGKQFCNGSCKRQFLVRVKIFEEKKTMTWRGIKRKVYK